MNTLMHTSLRFGALALAFLLTTGLALAQTPVETAEVEEPQEEMVAEEMVVQEDVVAKLQEQGSFTVLVAALRQTGLADALAQEGPFTVLAPTDEAFAALPAGTLDALTPEQLADVLSYHVIAGLFTSADVAPGAVLESLQGGTYEVSEDGTAIGGANLVATDIEASNGVIHAIDAVLLPATLQGGGEEDMMDDSDDADGGY